MGGACRSWPPIVPKGTMARCIYSSFFVLLILVSEKVCNSHSSSQPRGPEPGETPNVKHHAEDSSQAAGECPADHEQVN